VPADGTSAAGGKLRHVPVSWAALGQAAACQYLPICGTEIKAQGRVKTQFALEVPVVVISSPNAMKVYRSPLAAVRAARAKLCEVKHDDESSDQATAKVLPFPARTDCKSTDEGQ
jgi:hypothetical protein